MPMGHAWVEDGSTVYDYSNGREIKMNKSKYYNLGAIDGLLKKDTNKLDTKVWKQQQQY